MKSPYRIPCRRDGREAKRFTYQKGGVVGYNRLSAQ